MAVQNTSKNFLEFIIISPDLTGVNIRSEKWLSENKNLHELVEAGLKFESFNQSVLSKMKEEVLKQDWSEIKAIYEAHHHKWYNFIIGDFRKAKKLFLSYSKTIQKPQNSEIPALIDSIIIAQKDVSIITKNTSLAENFFNLKFSNPNRSYNELENLLDGIPARKKLLLIDACNSGEFDKESALEVKDLIAASDRPGKTKGKTYKKRETVIKSDFSVMKELFINTSNNTGSYIISATTGIQNALEGTIIDSKNTVIKNGAFLQIRCPEIDCVTNTFTVEASCHFRVTALDVTVKISDPTITG
jgi:hypothetical protein